MSVYRTLLADDVGDIRFMVRLALERSERFEVVAEAENGAEAIRLTEKHQPDLVLLDISMPVVDGLEALPRVRAACEDAAVVMLSGFEAARLGPAAIELGAKGYLEKGIPPTQLVDELLKLLGDRAA